MGNRSLIIIFMSGVITNTYAGNLYADIGIGVAAVNTFNGSNTNLLLRLDSGYKLNNFIMFELGCQNLNNTGNYNYSGSGMDLSVITSLPKIKNTQLNIFFRFGGGVDFINTGKSSSTSFVDVAGGGISYSLSSKIGIIGQWIIRGAMTNQTSANSYYQNDFLMNLSINF